MHIKRFNTFFKIWVQFHVYPFNHLHFDYFVLIFIPTYKNVNSRFLFFLKLFDLQLQLKRINSKVEILPLQTANRY